MANEDYVYQLLSNAGTSAGDRIYPRRLPENPAYPAISYFQITSRYMETRYDGADSVGDTQTDYVAAGQHEAGRFAFQIEAWGKTQTDATALLDEVVAAVSGWDGTIDGTRVSVSVRRYEDFPFDQGVDRYRKMVELALWIES